MRALLILQNDAVRQRAIDFIRKAPIGTRIEFKEAKRSLDQNSHMWAALTDIAKQAEHHGRKYVPEIWKVIFMSALGRETRFVPALDGDGLIPIGHRSSDLSKQEMSELIDFIHAWGAENGVVFHDDQSIPSPEKAA